MCIRFYTVTVVVLAMFFLMIGGCRQAGVGVYAQFNVQPPVAVGSELRLLQRLTVPEDKARLFFQKGDLVESVDFYYPHCELEVRKPIGEEHVVNPDRFVIVDIVQDESPIVLNLHMRVSPLRVAETDGSPADICVFWKMGLKSDDQPLVRYLTCRGVQDEPGLAEPPSLAEIQEALGGYFSLEG